MSSERIIKLWVRREVRRRLLDRRHWTTVILWLAVGLAYGALWWWVQPG
jgi:hypothetical protein